ncbi:hypothetical protein ACFO3O_06185 [Dokdonia ponticola]|uniref:Uncharacterized protein n=1 Tax=Dokdonia ponticola TaxID=2041041 RepID=A0ABV9HVF5_9FLAO
MKILILISLFFNQNFFYDHLLGKNVSDDIKLKLFQTSENNYRVIPDTQNKSQEIKKKNILIRTNDDGIIEHISLHLRGYTLDEIIEIYIEKYGIPDECYSMKAEVESLNLATKKSNINEDYINLESSHLKDNPILIKWFKEKIEITILKNFITGKITVTFSFFE